MSSVRTLFTLLLAFTVAATVCGCAFTLATAKPDSYIQNEKRVRHVLASVLGVSDSKILRWATVTSLGMIPGKNDAQLKKALEKEFQRAIPMTVLDRNPRVEDLITYFSDEQNIETVPKEKYEDFGPVAPSSPSNKDVQGQ